MPTLPWKLTIVPTTLLTFFLVFYTRDCFQRYYDLYKHCMGMTGRVIEFAGLLRSHCPKADADALFNLSAATRSRACTCSTLCSRAAAPMAAKSSRRANGVCGTHTSTRA